MCEEKEKFEFTHINERNNSEIRFLRILEKGMYH